jgi:hypothetical protein
MTIAHLVFFQPAAPEDLQVIHARLQDALGTPVEVKASHLAFPLTDNETQGG